MNSDQVMMLIRTLLTFIGSIAVEKGWISNMDLSTLTTDLLAVVGPAMIFGTFIWGLYAHSKTAKIASVNNIPGVKVVAQSTDASTITVPPVATKGN